MNTPANPQLRLTRDEMRELGYRAVDLLVEHFESISDLPPAAAQDRDAIVARLAEPIPEHGRPPGEVLDLLVRDVFGAMMHLDHPRFFAFVPSPNNFVGVVADLLVSGLNPFLGSWLAAAGPAELELVTIGWLRDACGLPASAGGLFVSGGSVANMTALAVARRRHGAGPEAVVYCSDQTHSSIDRALRVLGFAPAGLRKLRADARYRLDPRAVRAAVAEDRAAGRAPFCVVANAGTTNTGAVDPLRELAEVCREEGLWFHVDGAYGAASALSPEGRRALDGIEEADSLSLDPHKWLFQPIECGCVLVRDAAWLPATFGVHAEYLKDVNGETQETNFRDYGIQLTRGFRALKLWMSLKVFGRGAFAAAIETGLALARVAESEVRETPGWEVVTPAEMGIVTFRYAPGGPDDERLDALNDRLVGEMIRGGVAMLSSTRLNGRTVLRLCTINPRTTEEDVRMTIRALDEAARRGASS